MPDAPDSDPAPGLLTQLAGFFKGVGGLMVDLARVVLTGQATPSQNVFFGVGVLGLACVGGFAVAAYLNSQVFALAAFGGLTLVVLVLVVLMAWVMRHPPAAPPPAPAPAPVPDPAPELTAARKHLRAIGDRCYQIYHQVRAGGHSYPLVRSDEWVLYVEADGGLRAAHTAVITPVGDPIRMVLREFTGGSEVESFWDLGLEASGVRGADQNAIQLVALPADDYKTSKRAVLFFLPELQPEQEVRYTVRWRWPGLWLPLVRGGEDTWTVRVNSADRVPLVRLRFLLHPDLPTVRLANIGSGGGAQVPPSDPADDRGYREYVWEVADAPPGTEICIRLKS